MNTSAKSQDVLVQQAKDFFAYCDKNTHAYIRIYSTKKLMRALDHPYARDILWQAKALFEKIMHNDILYGEKKQLDFHNVTEVIEIVSQELIDQVLERSWAKNPRSIADLSMNRISKEYVDFLREQRKQESDFLGKNIDEDGIFFNPYEYLRNIH